MASAGNPGCSATPTSGPGPPPPSACRRTPRSPGRPSAPRRGCRASDQRYSSVTISLSVSFCASSRAGRPPGFCTRPRMLLPLMKCSACSMFELLSRSHSQASMRCGLPNSLQESVFDVGVGQLGGAEAGRRAAEVLRHAGRLDQRIQQRLGRHAARDGVREVLLVVLVRRRRRAGALIGRRGDDLPHQMADVELVLDEVLGQARRAGPG